MMAGGRRFVVVAWLLTLAALPAAAAPKEGGTLTIGTTAQVVGFDPFVTKATTAETAMVGGLIFGTPFGLDDDGHQYPSQALSVEASEDGMSFKVKLRPGMKFSDGSPFDAAAIAKHWARILDPAKNKAIAGQVEAYKEVVALDPVTVEYRMSHPFLGFTGYLSFNSFVAWAMPPQHEASAGAELNRKPIGAGPYMLQEWNQDGGMVLVRNPYYFDKTKQHFDKIVVKFIPDENSRYAAVTNGDIDIVAGTISGTLEQIQDARKNPKLQVISQQATGAFTLQFNTAKPPLDDVRVRQALAYAMDRDAYHKVVQSNEGSMAKSFWPEGSPWHCDVNYPEYDPAKAKALLQEYGKPVHVKLQIPAWPIGVLAGELYQSYWTKVGVDVELVQVQVGAAYIGPVYAGTYEAVLWDVPDQPDPDRQVYPTYRSGSSANTTHTNDPILDEALEGGRTAMNMEARRAAYCDFAREYVKYVPAMLADQHIYYAVANAKLHVSHNLAFGRFWPADDYWEQ
jgi:peptide/nickel transport system substrate-binding protein